MRDKALDLIAELDELARVAKDAQRKLAAGEAVSGHSALRRIETKAADAARHARVALGVGDA